jgi:glycosyltransferase 2 family protein
MTPKAAGTPTLDLRKLMRFALVMIPLGILANILLTLWLTDRELLVQLRTFPVSYLAAAAALAMVPWLTNALRMLVWTRFLGYRLRLRETVRIAMGMDLSAAITPTAAGGDVAKMALLVERGVKPGAAVSLATLGTLEDAVFFLLALPLALYLSPRWRELEIGELGLHLSGSAVPLMLVLVAVLAAGYLTVHFGMRGVFGAALRSRSLRIVGRGRRKLRFVWRDAKDAFGLIAKRGKVHFALNVLLTGVQWTARYSVISVFLLYLGVAVDPFLFFALQWLVFTLATFFPTPGATGGAEAAFYVVYGPLVPASAIGIATAGWRFFTFYFVLACSALLFVFLGRRQTPAAEQPVAQNS